MKITVIVEGESDKVLVETILRSVVEEPPFDVVAAGGRSSAVSLARSYFTLPESHVALLVDADTVNPQLVREQQTILTDYLAEAAPPWAFKVILAVPEIETCLFVAPDLLAAMLGKPITAETLSEARFQPRRALEQLMGSKHGDCGALREMLSRVRDLQPLAECGPLKAAREFIEMAPKAEWIARGFRWPQRTPIQLADGGTILVEPAMHRSSLLKNASTPRQAMTLRFYNVWDASGNLLGQEDELGLATMLGEKSVP
jgi:hypothetical protein